MEYNSLLLEASAVKGLKEEEFVRRGCRITHGLLPSGGEYYTLTERGDAPLVKLLGNRGMTADALGNTVLSRLNAGGKPYFCLLAPQVSVTTGVESAEIIAGISERVRPDLTILIDTLSTSRYERLGRCYQLGNFPLVPGSGVGNAKILQTKTRTLSLGVPLVIKLGALGVEALKDHVVTPADIDERVAVCGENIAKAINTAFGR